MTDLRQSFFSNSHHTTMPNIVFKPDESTSFLQHAQLTQKNDVFSTSRNETNMSRNQSAMPSVLFQQDDIESSGKLVDVFIQQDNAFPKLPNLLRITEQNLFGVSGLSDNDYPSYFLEGLPQVNTVSKVPLPSELVEQFRHMQCNCMMGLFPSINRAWLTIDSDIFVWNYEDGGDLAYFDGLSETILSVGLVKPKPGIFQSHIEYLLCLATSVEMVLLGVSFKRPSVYGHGNTEMHLLPDPLFSVTTDNSIINTIAGNDNGRILMGTKDGSLLELVYQAEDGWFSRRCRKINHSSSSLSFLVPGFITNAFSENDAICQIVVDEGRKILYTRSEKGTIQVFDLGTDGAGMSKTAALSQHSIVQNAVSISKTIDRSNFHPIVHISSIEVNESPLLHLVAITKSGVRLYFTTTSVTSTLESRPRYLQLLHVRLPPGFSSSSSPQRPKNVYKSHYKSGTTLLVASQTDDADVLWTLSNDSFPFQQILMEKQVTTCLDGHIWALSEVTQDIQGPKNEIQPPSVVTQHFAPARKFLFLSAQGSHIITKLRPVDQLRKLLEDCHGPDHEKIKAFFTVHGIAQSCATAIILACSSAVSDMNISEWATQAFLLYGSQIKIDSGNIQPHFAVTPINPAYSMSPSASGFAPHYVSTPQPEYQLNTPSQPANPSSYLSGRHQGLYLYFARIIRNFWNQPLIREETIKSPQGWTTYLTTRISSEQLSAYLESLANFKQFLTNNFRISSQIDNRRQYSQINSRLNLTPQQHGISDKTQHGNIGVESEIFEKKSVLQLQQLIARICEVLGLWKIICDHQIHVILSSLTKDQQNQLRLTSCRDFIISGIELSTIIVNKLISQYLDDDTTTDAISSRLREVCPSIYRSEDVDCSKALEKIIAAKKAGNQQEKDQLLRESLQLCKKITPQLNLSMVAAQFQSVHFYSGIVDLCLTAALNKDPQSLAVHYYKNGEPVEDQQGMQMFMIRMETYKIITDTLGQLLASSMSHPQSPSVPKQPGPPPTPDPNMLSPEQASQFAEQIFQLALLSEDELFHHALYDWLVEKKLTERLLQIKSPYLEVYLKKSQQPDNLPMLDLLWQYYEKNQLFSAAAKILAKLAEKHGTDINLQLRIEYLSRAVICVKSSEKRTLASNEGEFLHELEEKMEVARIQLQIMDCLQRQTSTLVNAHECISMLNADLFDISHLYEKYAEPFNLPECQLAILYCAGHHDNSLVESLWQNIVDREFNGTCASLPEARVAAISNRIKVLGKKYQNSIRFFPLAFLIKYLEKRSCEASMDVEWVMSTMLSLGIPFRDLLETYDKVYKSKDPCWQVLKRPLHLVEVIQHIILRFVNQPGIISANERRHFKNIALDMVSSYLVDLQSLAGTETSSGLLIAHFKSLQAKLERLN